MATTGNGNIVILVPVVRIETFYTGYAIAAVCYFDKNEVSELPVESYTGARLTSTAVTDYVVNSSLYVDAATNITFGSVVDLTVEVPVLVGTAMNGMSSDAAHDFCLIKST